MDDNYHGLRGLRLRSSIKLAELAFCESQIRETEAEIAKLPDGNDETDLEPLLRRLAGYTEAKDGCLDWVMRASQLLVTSAEYLDTVRRLWHRGFRGRVELFNGDSKKRHYMGAALDEEGIPFTVIFSLR